MLTDGKGQDCKKTQHNLYIHVLLTNKLNVYSCDLYFVGLHSLVLAISCISHEFSTMFSLWLYTLSLLASSNGAVAW